ncbi:MAG: hypothetical protein JWQ21_266 [Herminiimonas sp.]|nr:hypothetical protein [Herminiimonas sp.]
MQSYTSDIRETAAIHGNNNHEGFDPMHYTTTEQETLKDEMRNVIEEARMVLPGIQALFGFQTIAVFNNAFERLPDSGIWSHLIALGLVALSIALVMTPAAYNRLAEPGQVSRRMIVLSSRLISTAMAPLMCAFSLDVYVVLLAATGKPLFGIYSAALTFCVFAALWFVFPLQARKKR